MARHEGDFRSANGKPLEIDELLALLDGNMPSEGPIRENARACYLSSGDGWREAVKHLGGAFADDIAALTEAKDE
ncbi:MAG: hypothetical protein ACREBM_06535 [Sphingomicrobium sp.]